MVRKKVAIYCRGSKADRSGDRQEHDLLEFANKADYEVVGIFKETASGAKDDRTERRKIITLARKRQINAVLVTELTRWGRSTLDVLKTLQQLHQWKVSVIAQTGLDLDLSTPQGRLVATVMSGLAEFERDLLIERIHSGLEFAKARGKKLGRPPGHKKADRLTPKVMELVKQDRSYRMIAKELDLSKTTVQAIVNRVRQKSMSSN